MRDGRRTNMRGRFEVEENFSGVVVYRRRMFEDPVLTAYYLNGEPVYADSFLLKRQWWEGLLSEQEAESHLFGDAFEYASGRYGDRYVRHLRRYARETITLTEETVRDFGWEVEAEMTAYAPEEVASMFHVPYGGEQVREDEGRERKMAAELNALGFPVFYISGSKGDPYGFFHTIRAVRRLMDRVSRIVERAEGSIAFVLPLYVIARFDLKDGRAWVVTKDARRMVFALRYLKPAVGVPRDTLQQVAGTRCCRYVIWRGDEGTLSVFDGVGVSNLGAEEVAERVDGYLREYGRLIDVARSRVPFNVPPRMGKMILNQMIEQNPDIGGFVRAFASRFGINLEHE